jgi:O-antigen/teichoic acid export membrane protein
VTLLVNAVMYFLPTGVLIARALGPAGRGDAVTVLQWPATLGALASLGLPSAVCFTVSKSRDRAASALWTGVGLSLILSCVLIPIGLLLVPVLATTQTTAGPLRLMMFAECFYMTGGVLAGALQATALSAWNAGRSMQSLLLPLGILGLWLSGRATVMTITDVYVTSLILQTLYLVRACLRLVGGSLRPAFSQIAPLLGYGVKDWSGSIPRMISLNLDQLLLSVWAGVSASQLGVYAVAATVSQIVQLFAQAVGSILFPRIARHPAESLRLQLRTLRTVTLVALAVTTMSCASSPFLLPAVFGNGYRSAVGVILLLAPGAVALATGTVIANILQGLGKPWAASKGQILGAGVTVPLLLVLIPRLGIVGAAIASSVAYTSEAGYLYYALRRFNGGLVIA